MRSAVLRAATGREREKNTTFATIVKVNEAGDEGVLDHPISPFDNVTSAYVIQQSERPRLSPGLTTLSTRTYLRP